MLEFFDSHFDAAFAWAFGTLVQPALFELGLMDYWDEAYTGTETLLLGVLEIALLCVLALPLQRLLPAERGQSRTAVWTDFAYTLINRLGLLPLATFALTFPLEGLIERLCHQFGVPRITVDTLSPWLAAHPLAEFLVYLLLFDLLGYWVHRSQHRFHWWWELHAVHHSQRAMTVWTESRNHFLDDLLGALIIALAARLIGTPGSQFIWLVFAGRLIESLAHANVRFGYGPAKRLLVDPLFHRTHHAIGLGHEGAHRGVNFGVMLPWWDMLFRSAVFDRGVVPTGIRDQLAGRDYGGGLLTQQSRAVERLWERLRGHAPAAPGPR
ncbi:MAG TPA: sterol desaturase family protein [Burkholderiales bacterium]|jgi:sterol desaturase/sphingolipid hydroxylase (fatty acid hydroxylase superfamily)